jgi:hypothetical protein
MPQPCGAEEHSRQLDVCGAVVQRGAGPSNYVDDRPAVCERYIELMSAQPHCPTPSTSTTTVSMRGVGARSGPGVFHQLPVLNCADLEVIGHGVEVRVVGKALRAVKNSNS